jgi:hypothetical protein
MIGPHSSRRLIARLWKRSPEDDILRAFPTALALNYLVIPLAKKNGFIADKSEPLFLLPRVLVKLRFGLIGFPLSSPPASSLQRHVLPKDLLRHRQHPRNRRRTSFGHRSSHQRGHRSGSRVRRFSFAFLSLNWIPLLMSFSPFQPVRF